MRETVELLRNVVSLAVWTPFNEAWGQFDANGIARQIADLDPTRQVNHTSGWVDQGGGDVRSFHRYLRPFRMPRAAAPRPTRPASRRADRVRRVQHARRGPRLEPARVRLPPLRGPRRRSADGFAELHEPLADAVRRGLAATVYTQLTDVEDELNGLLTWDREVLKIDADVIRSVTATLHP